jgi:hypothetical protein
MLTIFDNFYIKKIKEINGGILEDWNIRLVYGMWGYME